MRIQELSALRYKSDMIRKRERGREREREFCVGCGDGAYKRKKTV